MGKKVSPTLLAFSAIALLLLTASPMLFSNPLFLQPVQAQTLMTFKTPVPARGTDPATRIDFDLTFNVYRTTSSPNPQSVKITGGTVQLQQDPENNGRIYNGIAYNGKYTNDSEQGPNIEFSTTLGGTGYGISSPCSASDTNRISLSIEDLTVDVGGPVECPTGGGGGNTASSSSSSSMTRTSAQDSDSDGTPDSSDRCTHNSEHRCFKEEGGTSSGTTTNEQQPSSSSSSSSSSGNQTR